MRRLPPSLLAIATAVALGTTGCAATPGAPTGPSGGSPTPGAPSSPPGSPAPTPSSAPAAPGLVLEVTTEGGFINPAATLGTVPQVVAESDGSIYTPGAPDDAAPGLATRVLVRNVGAAGVEAIRRAMKEAGLDVAASGGIAADTGSTVFTAIVDGEEVVSRFGASGGGPGRPGGPGGPGEPGASADPAAPGAAAMALLARLADPTVAWGGTTGEETAYAAAAYRVWAAPADATAETGAATLDWPEATPLASFGAPTAVDLGVRGLRSGVVSGPGVAALAPVLAAHAGTLVISGGTAWMLWIRPFFPDEITAGG